MIRIYNNSTELKDNFHTDNALLILKIHPNNNNTTSPEVVTISGERMPSLDNAVLANSNNSLVNVTDPVMLGAGLYEIRTTILGLNSDTLLQQQQQQPPPPNTAGSPDSVKFDSYLTVGFAQNKIITTYNDNEKYNVTAISFFDRILDYRFDPNKKMFYWSMPFIYNYTYLNNTDVFVHEELRVPKSFQQFLHYNDNSSSTDQYSSGYYIATVNGMRITARQLAQDPYNFDKYYVFHYLLNKHDILQIAQDMKRTTNSSSSSSVMYFTLSPGNQTTLQLQTSRSILTDRGGIRIALNWNPSQLCSNTKSNMTLHFLNAITSNYIYADVKYNLRIVDDDINGTVVYEKQNLLAKNGTDTVTIDFPRNGLYDIEVNVTELNNIQSSLLPDLTRIETARGVVVVPEFSSSSEGLVMATAILGAMGGGILLVHRRFSLS